MRKTLLLVYIHGFQGGDDTFASFPEHLKALISHALPNVDIVNQVYPKFETRGELADCVARFREWLENKVIDLEVANATPSPTIDPSVHVFLLGHSMGGIVAAETYLLLASEQPIPAARSSCGASAAAAADAGTTTTAPPEPDMCSFMFPHIQGILAFDTPFLGLAPSMIAHQLEGGQRMASSAYKTYSEVAGIFGWGSKSESNVQAEAASGLKALPAPVISSTADAAAVPKWQRWGKYAMFAGAAGAVAAGGAAALYNQRSKITESWGWAASHLLFIGDLAKPEILRRRVENLEKAMEGRGASCANLYTLLGRGGREGQLHPLTSTVNGPDRTFANLPIKARDESGKAINSKIGEGMHWWGAVNESARDETIAHMHMFTPRDNPGFYAMGHKSRDLITAWVDESWYNTSEARGHPVKGGGLAEDWEKADVEEDETTKDWEGTPKDWEGTGGSKDKETNDDDDDDDDDADDFEGNDFEGNDVRMRDEDKDGVVVDKA